MSGTSGAVIWFGVNPSRPGIFAVFSAISGKQPHYLLPEFALFALIVARLADREGFEDRRLDRVVPALGLLVGGAAMMALPFVVDRLAGGRGGIAVSKPVHISGSIDNARDFPVPPGGREARRGTQVIVRVTVGTDGRARGCSVYRPSPDPEADRITCQLVEARLGFRPATDASGNPVAAPFYWRQQWF